MLGNNADQFMTTPMRTSITTQSNNPAQMEMPAPRPVARTNEFMWGMGGTDQSFLPISGYVEAPNYSGSAGLDFKNPKTLMIAGAIGLGAYLLLFKGKKKRGSGRTVSNKALPKR